MAPKPGNAFAQQKELQRHEILETQYRDEDFPTTPTTTMSMFIDPDLTQIGSQAIAELKTPINVDHSHKPVTGRGKLGKRAFTDPLVATTSHFPGTIEPSSFDKQSSGLGYIKSKFTSRSKKNNDFEPPVQPSTKPAPSEYLSNTPNSATISNTRKTEAAPEAAPITRQKLPSQPLPSHLSTTTTQSIATRQSQYASLLKSDAMILGNMSMSPTRSGSYAIAGYPAVVGVSHRSIVSMAGSILEASPPHFGGSGNPDVFINSSAQPECYDSTYTAPLPPPPGDISEQHEPFQADKSSSGIDVNFINQFRQMCIQNNGFRQYLERIQQQTSNLRPGIATDVLPGVSVEMASRFAAHEHRNKEEFRRINQNLLTLNENICAIQRNLHNQMTQMNRKMDLLLEAQGIGNSSRGQHPRQDQDAMQQKLHVEAQRRQDEVMDPATMVAEEKEAATTAAANAFGASSPRMQISTPSTRSRKPTPLPTKLPIMAAALTSTPPHVPQLPQLQLQSSSIATVTITDPSITSPSAVTNARRIRQGHRGGQGDAGEENQRAGIMAKRLANAAPFQARGSHVHPALRFQEGIERIAGVKEKKQEDADNQVLWRRPSGDGEIGGRWYQAATQQ
jgi:hypothetical protein